ncbi:hypothetical protein NDA14_005045 [Ustilago hordei]|nr:hypothetical protein NDA14_005045 [Ustilago hordei]
MMLAALHIVKYLNQTQDNILCIGRTDTTGNAIKTYMDANWASDPNANQKSTSGSIVKVFRNIVTWNSHIQKCVASSAVKAEYIAGSAAIREALFHRHLLCGLGFRDHTPIIFTDNTGCIQVAKDQAMHSKFKHINTKYHLIQDHIPEGDIMIRYVKTEDNIADFLTKPVLGKLLSHTCTHLGIVNAGSYGCSIGKEGS